MYTQDALRVSKAQANFHFGVNYSFNNVPEFSPKSLSERKKQLEL